MNHAELAGGFIATSEDTIKVTPPTATVGLKVEKVELNAEQIKTLEALKQLDKDGLQLAIEYQIAAIEYTKIANHILAKMLNDFELINA